MCALAAAVLLVCPTVLAFFSGGYFERPRLIAGLVVWSLVLVLALVQASPLPCGRGGRAAVAGLVVLGVWSAASMAWAPLAGPALAGVERLVLYLGALLAAIGLLRDRRTALAVEPVLALGALVVIGYGLSERLLPEIVQLTNSWSGSGRLEQPLTYWNAEGLLAAIGFVLCVHLAGTPSRPRSLRIVAAAGGVPLAVGVYLSLSRGAIVAAVVGLVVLLACAPTWSQLRAAAVALLGGATGSIAAAAFPTVASLSGTPAERRIDGAIVLCMLLAITVVVILVTVRATTAEATGVARPAALPFADRMPTVAAVTVALTVIGLVVVGLGERAGGEGHRKVSAGSPARLISVSSNRYEYWRVGWRTFVRQPVKGVGAGGFRVVWLRERRVPEVVRDVHSLPLEIAVELGLPGLLGLTLFVGGVAAAAREALRHSVLAAGEVAALTTWALHASIDWDWQMPAVTLPALLLAGAVVAAAEARAAPLAVIADRDESSPPVVADPEDRRVPDDALGVLR